jgi:hypothetical protein
MFNNLLNNDNPIFYITKILLVVFYESFIYFMKLSNSVMYIKIPQELE